MKPARMQMQLHVVSRSGYPPRNLPHRFIAEVGGLQSFDEESGTDPKLRKTIEYKTEAVFLSADLPQNNGFGDRSHFRITEITTDAEFGVYSYTNHDWVSITHDFQLLFILRFPPHRKIPGSALRGDARPTRWPDLQCPDPICKSRRHTARYGFDVRRCPGQRMHNRRRYPVFHNAAL
jgi:hypothetical protein